MNGFLATEHRINKNLMLESTLKIKHIGLQLRTSLDLKTRWLRKMFAVIRIHFESCTHGLCGMETAWAISLSGYPPFYSPLNKGGIKGGILDKWWKTRNGNNQEHLVVSLGSRAA
jgi:hypothetical protein